MPHTPDHAQEFSAVLHDHIDGPLQELRENLASPQVETLLDASWQDNPLLMDNEQEAYAGAVFSYAANRQIYGQEVVAPIALDNLSEVVRTWAGVMALNGSKEKHHAGEQLSLEDKTANILRALKKGPEKLTAAIAKHTRPTDIEGASAHENGKQAYQMQAQLPTALLFIAKESLGTLYKEEAAENGLDVNTMVAEKLAADSRALQEKQKVAVPGQGELAEVYSRAMNMLGSLYFGANTEAFVSRVNAQYAGVMNPLDSNGDLTRAAGYGSPELANAAVDRDFARRMVVMTKLCTLFGTDPQLAQKRLNDIKAKLDQRAQTSRGSRLLTKAMRGNSGAQAELEKTQAKSRKDLYEAAMAKRPEMIVDSQQILIARSLVDAVAAEQIDFPAVVRTMELLKLKPLAEAERSKIPIQRVPWEIIPPGTRRTQGEQNGEAAKPSIPSGVDESRLERLENLLYAWGEKIGENYGEARIARSQIPNVPEEKQYYLAILPQKIGGVLMEHAVGDNDITQRNAMFMFRAESGLGRFGQVQHTWEDVFTNDKWLLQVMGARRMLHTDTLDDRIFEYLTRPADQLDEPRYFL